MVPAGTERLAAIIPAGPYFALPMATSLLFAKQLAQPFIKLRPPTPAVKALGTSIDHDAV
jgi:hypothetical protein